MIARVCARIVPPWHRAYVRSHPGWPFIPLGIFVSGAVSLLFPEAVAESALAIALPPFLVFACNVVWSVGGGLAFAGNLRGNRELEVLGLALVAGAVFSYWLTIFTVRPNSAVHACFILFLAAGCAVRSWHLVRHGYDGLRQR